MIPSIILDDFLVGGRLSTRWAGHWVTLPRHLPPPPSKEGFLPCRGERRKEAFAIVIGVRPSVTGVWPSLP